MLDTTAPAVAKLSTQTILSSEETDALLGVCGKTQNVSTGVEFVRREQEVDSVCLIVEGLVARTVVAKNGSRQITAFYVPGDIPDLHSLMQPKVSSSLRAMTSCRIVRIAHTALRDLVSDFPGLMEAFWRYTVWDAAAATEWVVNVGKRTGPERVAHLLCELAIKSGKPLQDGISFALPVTQAVLAEATGLSAVHVNRSLQALRRDDLLRLDHATVTIPDWKRMTDRADFDDAYMRPEKPLRLMALPGTGNEDRSLGTPGTPSGTVMAPSSPNGETIGQS